MYEYPLKIWAKKKLSNIIIMATSQTHSNIKKETTQGVHSTKIAPNV